VPSDVQFDVYSQHALAFLVVHVNDDFPATTTWQDISTNGHRSFGCFDLSGIDVDKFLTFFICEEFVTVAHVKEKPRHLMKTHDVRSRSSKCIK
jgi:hypothetical protein